MTAYGDERVAVEAMKAGAIDYVVKSSEAFAAMPRTVERALREWNLLQERELAAEARRQAEENFRRSIAESPLGIRIVSAEGEMLYANGAILDIYGYKDIEELKSTPAKNRYAPESYAEYQLRKKKRMDGKVEEKLKKTLISLRNALDGVVKVLSVTTEKRDPYTAGHRRTCRMASVMNRRRGNR
jgi:PAS domain S-box-containing protein